MIVGSAILSPSAAWSRKVCAGICMEYVPSYLPRVTPPQLDTLWFLVPGSRKTAKHPQLLTRAKQRWQLAAAGSLRDISTHSMVWAFWCVHCSPTRRGLGANVYYESQWISCVQVQESPSPDREILTPSILYKFYPFSPAGCGWLRLVRTLQHFQYILLFMFTEDCGHRLDPITRQNMESAIFKFANWTDFVWIVSAVRVWNLFIDIYSSGARLGPVIHHSVLVQNCRICKTRINLSVVNSGLIPQDQFLTPVSLHCNLHSKSHRTLCQLGVNKEMWGIWAVCSNLNTWNA